MPVALGRDDQIENGLDFHQEDLGLNSPNCCQTHCNWMIHDMLPGEIVAIDLDPIKTDDHLGPAQIWKEKWVMPQSKIALLNQQIQKLSVKPTRFLREPVSWQLKKGGLKYKVNEIRKVARVWSWTFR